MFDKFVLAGSGERSIRAYATLARVSLDYRLHAGPDALLAAVPLDELHRRNARRVCAMLQRNGGLYLKMGQAVAMQGALLPEEYQLLFGQTFDQAAPGTWSEVEKVVREDFGAAFEEVFGVALEGEASDGLGVVDREARASASIAQVHWARLPDGREVAIKVQRRKIGRQVSWDLWTLKQLTDYTAWATGLPMGHLGEFISESVMQETDFEHEARNAQRIAALVDAEPRLRDQVYIPKVYPELSSKRVLTTEWVDGAKLWDKERLTASTDAGGLGLGLGDVMTTVIELFSAQMFQWGFVHCDPHPGNIFVRRLPSGKPQIVLIDHGLYATLTDDFRRKYARFWKAMLMRDDAALDEIARSWGLSSAEPVANAALMRPYKASAEPKKKATTAEIEERWIKDAAELLGENGKWFQEFILIERSLGLIQGNNRFLGSPVNRLKLIGLWAGKALHDERQESLWQHLKLKRSLFVLDIMFYISMLKQYLGYGGGFEQELKEEEERQAEEMRDMVKEMLGVEV
ncbi:putative abc1 domain protein [Neofusicoccum parvum]|uniref:Abc1 domain protein n=1 Tax=Neofusicoccum parvum TaxID=310453 RepID=A0ACB5RXX5_9PEZI|nr:putative abc1 domain protein [Neofusicoccum parvum]